MRRICPSFRLALCAGGIAIAVVTVGAAVAAEPSGKDAAHARHENFEKLGDAFERLEKEAKKRTPDAAVIQRETTTVVTLGKESATWFPEGSGPGNGFKTKALADVWTQPAEFRALHERFEQAAEKLNQTVAAGDMTVVAAEVEHTGEACSECHKKFRKQSSLFSIFGGD